MPSSPLNPNTPTTPSCPRHKHARIPSDTAKKNLRKNTITLSALSIVHPAPDKASRESSSPPPLSVQAINTIRSILDPDTEPRFLAMSVANAKRITNALVDKELRMERERQADAILSIRNEELRKRIRVVWQTRGKMLRAGLSQTDEELRRRVGEVWKMTGKDLEAIREED